jgi:hypothetical protein
MPGPIRGMNPKGGNRVPDHPSRRAKKLREAMIQSPAGWGPDDLGTLYQGYGFDVREGTKHRLFVHPQFRQIRATIPRHSYLAVSYVRQALKDLERLEALEAENDSP